MADRFPSIEDLSEDHTGIPDGTTGDEQNFLDRERAALGDDADLFATPGDNVATVEDGDEDLLGGDMSTPPTASGAHDEDISGFESSFPAIDNRNEQVGPGGTITGPSVPQPSYSSYAAPEEEPEVIREWRERRTLALEHRAQVAADKKAKTIEAAQKSIDDFYELYNSKRDKNVAQTRREAEEFMAGREDTSSGGTSWDRIAKLVDLSGKGAKGGAAGTGKERFRELLTSLRKDEKAPGASGI